MQQAVGQAFVVPHRRCPNYLRVFHR